MGKLIRFDARRRFIPEQRPKDAEAKVLIFTGVRYERSAGGTRPGKLPPANSGRGQG